MSLAARQIERAGIRTVCFSQVEEFTQLGRPPRRLVVEGTELGFPLGHANDRSRHRMLVAAALALLQASEFGARRSL